MEENKARQLKKLIEEANNKIELKKAELERTQVALNEKQNDVESAEAALEKFKFPKIFTKKEKLERERTLATRRRQILEEEKINIESKTREIFEEAQRVRQGAVNSSEKEKELADAIASKMEFDALEKEARVKHAFAREKEKDVDTALAKKAIAEAVLKSSQNQNSVDADKVNQAKTNKQNADEHFLKLKSEAEEARKKAEVAMKRIKFENKR